MTCVLEALELEDTIKNYEQRDATGWFVALLSMTFIIFPLLLPCLPQTDLIFRQSLTGGFIVSRHKRVYQGAIFPKPDTSIAECAR